MIQRQDNNALMTVLEIINSNGLECPGEAVFILIPGCRSVSSPDKVKEERKIP